MFYMKLSIAVMQVKSAIEGLKTQREPTVNDYRLEAECACRAVGVYREPLFGERNEPIESIALMAINPVIDPMVVATSAVYLMRKAWEYERNSRKWRVWWLR